MPGRLYYEQHIELFNKLVTLDKNILWRQAKMRVMRSS